MKKFVILLFLYVFNVNADISNYNNYDDDLDPAFNDIFDDFYDSVLGYNYKQRDNSNSEDDQPKFSNGAWMCGDCTSVDDSKLLYGESLEIESNDNFNEYVATQIAFALNNMRCIAIQTNESNTIHRVSGSCVGDEVTLSVLAAFNMDIRIYG